MAYFEGCEHFKHSPFLLQITAAGRGLQIYSHKEQVNQKSTPPHPAFYWRLGQQIFFVLGNLKRTVALCLKSKLFCSLVLCEFEPFVDCQLEGKKVHLITCSQIYRGLNLVFLQVYNYNVNFFKKVTCHLVFESWHQSVVTAPLVIPVLSIYMSIRK